MQSISTLTNLEVIKNLKLWYKVLGNISKKDKNYPPDFLQIRI
ncbi:hypothetical protein EV03_0955 [Prochlorococcus marinus str. PAC1]|uniref:Uncharacterized protein n=1 Tax=Prochlorococcus marinus str. PAC1 TaxID=59924 RepID=A0A0A2C823_PROMR|nr:hypothetical protein EV03_0955 [Prochlorococcus marinus str. PAC1]